LGGYYLITVYFGHKIDEFVAKAVSNIYKLSTLRQTLGVNAGLSVLKTPIEGPLAQYPGRFLGIIGQTPTVFPSPAGGHMSRHLSVFALLNWVYFKDSLKMICEFPEVLNM
jgi:hypothetical protein